MSTAVVVGAGPNGLAAAVALARAGVQVTVLEAADEVGGGTRTSEAIVPGLLHDHCSAIHPMAVGSPFLTGLGLERYGLTWRLPEIDCVHPLDDGRAGVLYRSVEATADGLGVDGGRWRGLFGWTSATLRCALRGHHGAAAAAAPPSADAVPVRCADPAARLDARQVVSHREGDGRCSAGVAAHAFRPLHRPMTSAIGLGILTAGHRYGWPVAAGGSQSITDALAALLADLGGKIETGIRIDASSQLPPADVTVFDLAPQAVAGILGDRLPNRIARAYRRFRRGPGAFKVDFAVEGGVPWTNPSARRAGTVHLAGTYAEIAATERDIHAGRMPHRPFVLVGQQYLADPSRSVGNVHPVWAYAHVPNGYAGDATEAIVAQIERFAPGFRERVIGHRVTGPATFAADNPELRRRRHHDRRQRHPSNDFRPTNHSGALQHWHTGYVHVLGRDAARPRCAWDVRLLRSTSRAASPRITGSCATAR